MMALEGVGLYCMTGSERMYVIKVIVGLKLGSLLHKKRCRVKGIRCKAKGIGLRVWDTDLRRCTQIKISCCPFSF